MQILYEDEFIVVGRDNAPLQGEIFVQHKQDKKVVIQVTAELSDDNQPYLQVRYHARATVGNKRSEGKFTIA